MMRPDGLYDHTLPNGLTVPLALPPGYGSEQEQIAQFLTEPKVDPMAQAGTANAHPAVDPFEQYAPAAPQVQGVPEGVLRQVGVTPESGFDDARPISNAEFERRKAEQEQRALAGAEPSRPVDEARELARQYLQGQLSQRPGAGRKVPAHDQLVSFTRQPGQALPEDVKADYRASVLDPAAVEQGAANALALRQEARDMRAGQLSQEVDALAAQSARRDAINAELETKRNLILKRDAELDRVEPRSSEQIIADKGFFPVAMAAVLAGLQGFLNSRRGVQGNSVVELMERQVRQKLDEDRAKYDRALQRGQIARGDYADAIKMYGTPESAELAMKAQYSALYEKLLENYADKIGDEQIKMQAQTQVADLRGKRAEMNQQLFELEHGKTLQESWKHVPAQTVGGGVVDPVTATKKAAEMAKALREINGEDDKGGIKADTIVRDPATGEQLTAPDADTAKKARMVFAASQTLKANIARQKALMSAGANSLVPGGGDKREFDDLVERNKLVAKELFDLGAITPADVDLISPVAGTRVWHSDEQTLKRLDSATQTVDQKVNTVKQNLYRGSVQGGQPALGRMPASTKVVK